MAGANQEVLAVPRSVPGAWRAQQLLWGTTVTATAHVINLNHVLPWIFVPFVVVAVVFLTLAKLAWWWELRRNASCPSCGVRVHPRQTALHEEFHRQVDRAVDNASTWEQF